MTRLATQALPGQWVQIHRILLEAGSRAPQIPDETQAVPLEMWVKGFLVSAPAVDGDEVEVVTVTARRIKGRLVNANPVYGHGFGEPVPELLTIGRELRGIIARGSGEGDLDGVWPVKRDD